MTRFLLLIVLGGVCCVCASAHASQCAALPANPSQGTIQGALNSCGDGNYVQLSAGTTAIGGSLNIPCGVMLVGPTATPATAVLNGGNAIGYIASMNGNCSSANNTGASYVDFDHGGGIAVDGSTTHSNVTVLHSQFTNIPDSFTPCTSGCTTANGNGNANTTGAVIFNMGTPTTINGFTFEYNNVSDANSCSNTINKTYVSSPSDGTGGPDGCGIEIFGQGSAPYNGHMVNLQIKYNHFYHIDEAMHFYGSNFASGAQANTCDNCDIEYNWFEFNRRITIEFQMQMINHPLIISNNVFDTPGNGNFNTYYISTPCCNYGSTFVSSTIVPSYLEQNNVEIDDSTGSGGSDQAQWAVEYWGNGSLSNYNLVQGYFCTGYQVGYPGQNATPFVQYNSLEGPVMAQQANCYTYGGGHSGDYLAPEFNNSYQGATITPNITTATITSVPSVAPAISPASGAYNSPPTVTLTDPGYTSSSNYFPHGNTSIWYTTDGSTPVPGSGTARIYTGPLTVVLPATIKAVGMWGTANQPTSYPAGYGFTPSGVVSASYTSTGGVALNSVAVTAATNTLNVGQTVQLTATCTYSTGATSNCNTTDAYGNSVSNWLSSSAALTVSSSGLVTAVSAGSANFTATVSGQTSPPYTITSAAPQISLSSDNLATAGNITSLTAGSVNQLTATCNYSDGSSTNCSTADSHGNDASFSSTAAGVATVSASGLATAVAAGTTILQAAVQFGAAQANWGGTQENTTGVTFAGSINETYFVLGSQSGGYTTQSCSFFLPSSTLTVGAKFDCGLISATTPTSQASSWLCYGTYTVTSASAPNAWVTVPMSGCGTLAAGSAWWVALSTNQSGPVTTGYYNCSGSCSGAAPSSPGTAPGSGTYSCGYVSGISYGVYSGIPTSVTEGCGPGGTQASQYVTLGQPPITSNTVSLTVTASAPTLVSAALTASGSPSTLTVGQTLQFAAKCTYSDGSVTDCTVADIWGNKVTQWQSSQPGFVSINSAGLATAIAAGAAQLSANIGSLVSSAYALTAQAVAVTLANVSLNTTGGVTGLFVGSTNHLIATCLYSDNSTTICTSTDSHGNKASGYTSSNPAIATVNATSGLVTGVAPGTTNLTATAGGKTSSPRAVTVLAVPMGVYTITISGPVKFSGKVEF